MKLTIFACALALAFASQASAQSTTLPDVFSGNGKVKAGADVLVDSKGVEKGTTANPVTTSGKAETIVLATANTAAAATTVYGGRYVFAATCSTWVANGVALTVRGPDGATFTAAGQYSANTSVEVGVGSSAVVAVAITTGSAGCNATLTREP